jgi:tetratricopeptide (TPR) repeat protein
MKKFSLIIFAVLLLTFPVFAQTEVEVIIEKAKRLSLEEKTEAAIELMNKALQLEPQNPDVYLTRAEFYFVLDKTDEVLKDAQKAAELAPTDRKILYFSASVLRRSQFLKEALTIADRMIALGDVDRFGWSQRIQIKMQLQDFVGAYEDVATALELFPKENMFKQNQALLIRLMGDSDKALQMYNALIESAEKKSGKQKNEEARTRFNNDLGNFLFARAGLYLSQSNPDAAKADLLKAINYAPTDYNYYRRARVYRELKMYAEAEADLTKALEVFKQFDKIQILIERGDVYVLDQKYDEALKDYQEFLKLDIKLKDAFDARVVWLNQMRDKYSNQPK